MTRFLNPSARTWGLKFSCLLAAVLGLMLSSCFHKSVAILNAKKVGKKAMEIETRNKKIYFHYDHADYCKSARWTAKECYQFMSARPWSDVLDFYSNLVNGRLSLSRLFCSEVLTDDYNEKVDVHDRSETRSGRWERVTFKIILSYNGGSFGGWQKQPGLNTVQELVEKSLGRFVDNKKAELLKEKCKPVEGCVVVAGRTDKGVSAIQQVCSFYTWRKDVKSSDIEEAINNAVPGKLSVISVSQVSREFHPNFSAKWRRYLYILPLNDDEKGEQCYESEEVDQKFIYDTNDSEQGNESDEIISEGDVDVQITDNGRVCGSKPTRFSVSRVNQILQQLEGKFLSYKMFARDTKASRNTGPPTECFMYHARAAEARLPCLDHSDGRKVMCVELIANRFLRKMVRVLVATAVREAAAGAQEDALIKLMDATCRRATAPPSPPEGLPSGLAGDIIGDFVYISGTQVVD